MFDEGRSVRVVRSLVLAAVLAAGAKAVVHAGPALPAGPAIPATAHAAEWKAETLASIDPDVFDLAMRATTCAVKSGDVSSPSTLTVIDYSKPSTEKRMWVFDLKAHALLYRELVAHGQGTGDNLAKYFSNEPETHRSSIGLYVTEDTYIGKNGYSLRLNGLDRGFNDHALERAIVMHGAPYVSDEFAKAQGRLGRSWGCPALREGIAREVIDRVKGGSLVFAYYPDPDWIKKSKYLTDTCDRP